MIRLVRNVDLRAMSIILVVVPALIAFYCLLIPNVNNGPAGGLLFEVRQLLAVAALSSIVIILPCLLAAIAKGRAFLLGLTPCMMLLLASYIVHLPSSVCDLPDWRAEPRLAILLLCAGVASSGIGVLIRWLVSRLALPSADRELSNNEARRIRSERRSRIMAAVLLGLLPTTAMSRVVSAFASQELLASADQGTCPTRAIDFLIAAGADVKAKNADGKSPIMCVVDHYYWGDTACLKHLILRGGDVNARDNHGRTALMDAAKTGRGDCVNVLLLNRADVNAKDDEGATPLMYAADNDSSNCASILLLAGADPDIKNNNGETADDLAREHSIAVERILQAWKAKRSQVSTS